MIEPEVRKKLVENLREYADRLNSTANIENFKDFKDDELKKKIKTIKGNSLEKNLALKTMLAEYLKSCKNKRDVYFWIINNWGGIRTFKKEESNLKRIEDFLKKLEKSKNDEVINSISSLSKVSSFVNPQEYFIYDSRAIFSLNWLLKKSGESKRFYCQPKQKGNATRRDGSKRIACYDLLKIIRDEFKSAVVPTEVTIQDYLDYCNLIKDIYLDVFTEDKEKEVKQPYKLEMLLFWIAPKEILDEVDAEYKGRTEYDKSLNTKTAFEIEFQPFWEKLKRSNVDIYRRKAPATDYYYINNDLWMKVFSSGKYKRDVAYQCFSISRRILNDNDILRKKLDEEFSAEIQNGTVKADYKDKIKIVYYRSNSINGGKIYEDELIKWFNDHAKNLVTIINDNK